jgi:glycosyltransferase involved in cell wall biosynthesis
MTGLPARTKDDPSVRKILLVIPQLDYRGPSRLFCLLAAGLPPETVRVCVLGESSPWCDELRAAGITVDVLGWRRFLDVRPLVSLKALIGREKPDLVHAWGFAAAWTIVLCGARLPGRLLLSAAMPPWRRLSFAERWLLRRCGGVIAVGRAEAVAYQRLGVPANRLSIVPPAEPIPEEKALLAPLPGLPSSSRVILTLGPLERHKGHRNAVWALDILNCLYDDVRLVLVGTGPDEQRVCQFTSSVRLDHRVHFTGVVADVQPWLARCEVVWIPSLRDGGRQSALTAMAAGRAVVATRLPRLAEVVADGRTGFLVTLGDKMELARQTRILLDHHDVRRDMGAAARQHVEKLFPPARMVSAFAEVYERP